jgi:hypothetical protein
VNLIIDRCPLQRASIALRVKITNVGVASPPASSTPIVCYLDTGFAGEFFCWRAHLVAAGIDPDMYRDPRRQRLRATLHAERSLGVPIRRADVWLLSNLPEYQDKPYRVELKTGISFRNAQSRSGGAVPRAILGMQTLLIANAKVEIDFDRRTYSLWVPDFPS